MYRTLCLIENCNWIWVICCWVICCLNIVSIVFRFLATDQPPHPNQSPSTLNCVLSTLQGDIFAGINDGILSRAEALAAVDIQKHQAQHVHSQMPSQIKHDVMYHHHTMSGPPQRPLQVSVPKAIALVALETNRSCPSDSKYYLLAL